MLFSEFCKIVVKKVTFVGFREDRPNRTLWIRTSFSLTYNAKQELIIP